MTASTLPKEIRLVGTLDLQAAKAGEYPRFTLLANTGQPMRIEGYPAPVIVDLAGASFKKKKTVVVAGHDTTGLGKRIGHTLKQRIDQSGIWAEGIVSSQMGIAQGFVEDAKAGFPFECSIGADIEQVEFIPEGESATVNGKSFAGPLIVARRVSIRELSVCVLGADSNTTAVITATRQPYQPKSNDMTTDLEAARKAAAQEELRLDRIRAVATQFPNLREVEINGQKLSLSEAKAHAIEANWPADQFELLCRRSDYPRQDVAPRFHRPNNSALLSPEALQGALLMRAGYSFAAEKLFDARTLEASHSLKKLSLGEMAQISLQAEGRPVPNSRAEAVHQCMLTADGYSLVNMPNALGGALDKLIGVAFQEAGATWRSFAAIKSIPNFREHTLISPQSYGQLEQVPATGLLSHGSLGEEISALRIGTYGKLLKVSREALVNDDLGIFDEVYRVCAIAAMRKLNDLVYETVMANANDHFHEDHGNLLTDGSALSKTSLAAAVQAIRKQRDSEGNDLDLVPKVLVVPPELEVTAKEILNSIEVEQTEANTPRGNALLKAVSLETESRLSNDEKFAPNASPDHWFLFCGPEAGPVNVGFLDGVEAPKVEIFGLDHEANTLAVQFRVYADYGVALGSYRAGVKATGEAGQ